jgi:hypothetical protein
MIPSLFQPVADPMETVKTIKEIGADRCTSVLTKNDRLRFG